MIRLGDIPDFDIPDFSLRSMIAISAGCIFVYAIGEYWSSMGGFSLITTMILLILLYLFVNRIETLDERNNYFLIEPEDSKNKIPVIIEKFTGLIEREPRNDSILLGNDEEGEPVYWEYMNPLMKNRHMTVIGGSGSGKTYLLQKVIDRISAIEQATAPLIIDYTNGFLKDQLEPSFIKSCDPKSHLLIKSPLSINPLCELSWIVEGQEIKENSFEIGTRIMSVIKSVYSSMGEQQTATLVKAIDENMKLNFSFDELLRILEDEDLQYKNGQSVASKLSPFVKSNVFSADGNGWQELLSVSSPQIIQLAGMSSAVQKIIAEFSLWDLWNHASRIGDKSRPIPVVLDEVQNLDLKAGSPVDKMLTEGRKFGLSMILATQYLSKFTKPEQDGMFQAGHKLIFQPADTELSVVSKMMLNIDTEERTERYWKKQLSGLGLGQCFSIGIDAKGKRKIDKLYITKF